MKRFPSWLKRPVLTGGAVSEMEFRLREQRINTVCKSARCPNIFECFSKRHATFMILGNICSRSCGFCSLASGTSAAVDAEEPRRIAAFVKALKMRYVIITSVTRDDLPGGGASQFADTIRHIRAVSPSVKIEVLVPDFGGDKSSIGQVVGCCPDIFAHNIETVPRLYGLARRGSDYRRSLAVLEAAKKKDARIVTKSGIMLGLGEREDEVIGVLKDFRLAGVSSVVIGQYLKPSPECIEVEEFVHPDLFKKYGAVARDMGFLYVLSEPFARSSYKS